MNEHLARSRFAKAQRASQAPKPDGVRPSLVALRHGHAQSVNKAFHVKRRFRAIHAALARICSAAFTPGTIQRLDRHSGFGQTAGEMATAETSVLFETRRILNRSKLAGGKAFGEHSAFGVRYFGKKSVPYLGRNKPLRSLAHQDRQSTSKPLKTLPEYS